MSVCVSGLSDDAPGPCLGWDTPVGIAVNLMFWAGLAAFLLFFFRVARVVLPLMKQWRMDDDELWRIVWKGINPWLFFGAWGVWFGMIILANSAR